MSLPHALITALIERPGSSGLELAQRFDKSIGHFWNATHQQIYRELGKLETDGLIASEAQAEARGRKRNYRVLPAGTDMLRQWLGQEEALPVLRDVLMVKLRAEAVLGPNPDATQQLAATLQTRLEAHRAKLAEYEAFAARDFAVENPNRATQLHQMILKAGLRHERGWIETLQDALSLLQDH